MTNITWEQMVSKATSFTYQDFVSSNQVTFGAWGSVVVKALHY
jgi:hypothetical protein